MRLDVKDQISNWILQRKNAKKKKRKKSEVVISI